MSDSSLNSEFTVLAICRDENGTSAGMIEGDVTGLDDKN